MIKVLHITAHLGGGVGRVLSKVSIHRVKYGSGVKDVFVCLEKPEKDSAMKEMRAAGVEVYICPSQKKTDDLILNSDIVQIEWWHHPIMTGWMCKNNIYTRLIIWSHTSGLHYPHIPKELVDAPRRFLFTTPASEYASDVVNSSGGFDDIDNITRVEKHSRLSFGYMGSLNFSKLHPDIMKFIEAVDTPGFVVDFYGDLESNDKISSMADDTSVSNKINLHGFTDDPYSKFSDMDVLVYILNPDHYGTTENALLEAMAAGVVPIVLNNKVESCIVDHFYTGIVVDSIDGFVKAIDYLNCYPDELLRMSKLAKERTRQKYSLDNTVAQLDAHYLSLIGGKKRGFDFKSVLGECPHEWFFSCLGKYRNYFSACKHDEWRSERLKNPILYERSKGSVFQYHKSFPKDIILKRWANMLEGDLKYEEKQ